MAGVAPTSTSVAIALGSNLGDREATLRAAIALLGRFLDGMSASRFYDTDPVGVVSQPTFLNGAVAGHTKLAARPLLDRLLDLERKLGRERPYPGAARTLDLDLILYGDAVLNEPGLIVPHPRFRERLFVLEPLADVAASWRDPVSGLSVRELLDRRRSAGR